MQSTAGDDFHRGLDKKLSSYRPRTKGMKRKLLAGVARSLAKRADEDYLLEAGGTRWLTDSEALVNFIQQRSEGEVLVRVLGPDPESGRASSIVNTCLPDQPFVVDTLRLCFEQLELPTAIQINAIVAAQRTAAGKLKGIDAEAADSRAESITHFEIPALSTAKERRDLEKEITDRILQVRAMSGDFRRMLRQIKDQVNQYEFLASLYPERRDEILEARGFLQWISDDNFVFMGMSSLSVEAKSDEFRLGLSRLKRDPFEFSYSHARKFAKERARKKPRDLVRIYKTGEESRLHRRGKIDEVLLRTFDDRGNSTGCLAIHGLFTYRGIQARGASVPLLRQKLSAVIEQEEVVRGTYNYKSVVNAFNSLPVEYLFGAEIADVRRLIRRTLAAERAHRMQVHLSLGTEKRSAFLFVVLPRQNFSDELRSTIQSYLQEVLGANYADHRVLMSTYGVAVLHFYMTSAQTIPGFDVSEVEEQVLQLSATWEDRLRTALLRAEDRDRAIESYRIYHRAFSPRYEVSTDTAQAVADIRRLERVRAGEGMQFGFYRDAEDEAQQTMKLRIYQSEEPLLSDVMPILDHFGLRVVNSFVNHARLASGEVLVMETFRFELRDDGLVSDECLRHDFLAALGAVFSGRMASDALNRILLPAGLGWEEVDLLRSYQEYSRQLGNVTTPATLWPVLVRHAEIVRSIVEFFELKFGPDRNGKIPARPTASRTKSCAKAYAEILASIDRVASFHDDRILRTFANLVDATLRTSFYRTDKANPTISHKFDCAAITSMKDPRPWREIFVHHRNLEGVHLRGGKIARGGLRWSDRPDDFRTEILGLMTTQMVKNVVIVPLGAKGGFVVKKLPSDPAERRAAGDSHYEIFVNALLDVTDNRVGDDVVSPPRVICYDEEDPYFVVAADKGTAHLSDTANRISQERGFWLGDAFASGGSNGYDHKGIGITARGAWVCIRHHLRELGIHPEQDTFTCVGIGDMGGDVFGNGLIEHDTTRLQAAFNHLHIFLDPDPDPKVSFRERRRLFDATYSGWDAYDKKKISKGGGVFDRHAKKIELSAAVQKMLGVEVASMSGNELVSAILRMPVDLWYNGGIGTYVKATGESHAEAADPSNDAVRILASELRARVVGEGGNLGLTQGARVEFAQLGGKINTDFIDNAGGVNTSDHEVNLKILFAPELREGRLKEAARNRLLHEIELTVTHDVLEANGDQALMLSLDERRSQIDLAPFDGVIDELCRHFQVKRGQLGLPTARAMDQRMAQGQSLTRPELATISSFVKMKIYSELLEDESLAMEGLRPALHNYFPEPIRKKFAAAIDGHSLRREIALTRLTNRVLDHTGATFFHEMATHFGATPRHIFEAYSLLSRAADLWTLKDSVLELGNEVSVEAKYEALLVVEGALRHGTRHLLEHWPADVVADYLADTDAYSKLLAGFEAGVEKLLDPVSLEGAQRRTERYSEYGMPAAMARRLALVRYLPRILVVLDLAESAELGAAEVGEDYFRIGRASNLFSTLRWIDDLRPRAYYDALAYHSLRRQLHDLLSDLVLRLSGRPGSVEERLAEFPALEAAVEQLERLPADQMGPASLLVIVQQMRQAL